MTSLIINLGKIRLTQNHFGKDCINLNNISLQYIYLDQQQSLTSVPCYLESENYLKIYIK